MSRARMPRPLGRANHRPPKPQLGGHGRVAVGLQPRGRTLSRSSTSRRTGSARAAAAVHRGTPGGVRSSPAGWVITPSATRRRRPVGMAPPRRRWCAPRADRSPHGRRHSRCQRTMRCWPVADAAAAAMSPAAAAPARSPAAASQRALVSWSSGIHSSSPVSSASGQAVVEAGEALRRRGRARTAASRAGSRSTASSGASGSRRRSRPSSPGRSARRRRRPPSRAAPGPS